MNIPFTRNGKLDDTYDTKDNYYILYADMTSTMISGKPYTKANDFFTDSTMTTKVTSENKLPDLDKFLQHVYRGTALVYCYFNGELEMISKVNSVSGGILSSFGKTGEYAVSFAGLNCKQGIDISSVTLLLY